MSEKTNEHGHDEHAVPEHSLMKKLTSIAVLGGLPLVVVIGMISAYKAQERSAPASMDEQAVMARIQKVGSVALGKTVQAPRTGEEVYKAQCSTCHAAGLLGAPKFSDAAAWAPRIKIGYEALLVSALKGKGNMTPQGGGAFSNDEVARALVYMANAGGGKFAEPKAPAETNATNGNAQSPASASK